MKEITLICDGSSGDVELERHLAIKLQAVHEVFKKKQASYGPGNISTFGILGVIVRMYDKMQRLKRLLWDQRDNTLDDESVQDTLIDMADYAVIALIVLDGGWPQ